MAVQRPRSHLCVSREGGMCLVPFFLALSPCHFSFLHPIPLHFSHYPPTKTSQLCSLLAKDFQKLLGVHLMAQAMQCFLTRPPVAILPLLATSLLVMGEQWAYSNLWCPWGLP